MYAAKAGGIFVLLLTLLFLLFYGWSIRWKQDSVYKIPNKLQKYLMYAEMPVSTMLEVNALKHKVEEINMKREVKNWMKFGPVVKETTTIVVQVHRDIKSLQYLIISLAQVRFVESVLIIFSHSYYSEDMYRLIQSIDFCKVMQIFYPHSVQLHPDSFPGKDSEDYINGSQTKSNHNQQRDGNLTESKHHWWWKANFIFEQLEWSLSYTGTVIFLEEDHYVAPDLLHMLQYVKRSLSSSPDVEIMSFGTMYLRNLDPRLLTLEYWRPPFDVGVAFNKSTWNKIVELSSFYCMYDDCSWSYSLLNVFKNFPKSNINMVACHAPRVIATKQFDNADHAVLELSHVFSNLPLFPEKVKVIFLFGPNGKIFFEVKAPPRGNGGWMNIKDHLLCLDPLTVAAEDIDATTTSSRFDQYPY